MSGDTGPFRHYLLAAGHGRRSGGPKAWRETNGVSLLERHVRFVGEHFPEDDRVVAVQERWRERCESIDSGVRWVSVDPDAPPIASFLELLRAAPLDRWGFLYHVDMPVWDPDLFRLLAERARGSSGVDALVPTYDGRGGHPVVLAPAVEHDLLALDPATDRLDHWLRDRRVDRIAVPIACVIENWNDAADGRT